MKPNMHQLAMRDGALAAFLGLHDGSDFGHERAHSAAHVGSDFGSEWGAEFGDDYGAEFGAAAPSAAAMMTAVGKNGPLHPAHPMHPTNVRARLLNPNAGSAVKVEGYALALNQTLTFGTAASISASLNPDVLIKPQVVSANVTFPALATLTQLQVANVNAIIGGSVDLFLWQPNAVNRSITLPRIEPSQRLSMAGSWTTFVPPGFAGGSTFPLTVQVSGPAIMAGQ